MTQIKTSELTGAALDWAVAKCEGAVGMNDRLAWYTPSIDWVSGGPIIEQEKINMVYRPDINCMTGEVFPRWLASVVTHGAEGPTLLIAAMRCYVASKMGDEVEIPTELVK